MKHLSNNDFNDNPLVNVPDGVLQHHAVNKGQLDTSLDGKKSKTSLVTKIRYPHFSAHRGGKNLYPEMSLEAYEHARLSGFSLECDVQALSDGTLVLLHDTTVDRTMTGATGSVSSLTPEQWENCRIRPVIKGGKDGTPMFFDDFLDRYGGQHVIAAELKSYASVTPFINAIKERSLENDVIVQCFDQATAETMAGAGLRTMFLFSTTTPATPSQLVSAGIEYIGASFNASSGTISPFKSAGLKAWAYTANTKAQLATAQSAGFDAFFSDDPWYISDRYTTSTTLEIDGYLWPRYRSYVVSAANADADAVSSIKGKSIVPNSTNGAHNGYVVAVEVLPLGKLTAPFKVAVDIRFDEESGSTVSAGIILFNNTSTPEAKFTDGARTGQNGFAAVMRRNGQMQVWKYVNGAAASSITSSTALTGTNMVAPVNQPGWTTLEFEHTGTTLYLRSPQLKTVVSAADTFKPTDMTLMLRGVAGRSYEISDIRVER